MMRRWSFAFVCVAMLGVPLLGSLPAAAAPRGQLTVTPESVTPGESVDIIGFSLAPSAVYQVTVCGDEARRGSADCSQASSQTRTTSAKGSWGAQLVVSVPPVPCPCVVAAFPNTGGVPVTTPLDIVGAPTGPLLPIPAPLTFSVSQAQLQGSGPWQSFFGASAKRTLVLTVHNGSTQSVFDPPISVRLGKGANPTQIVPTQPLGTIPAGGVRSFQIPVTFPAFAVGTYVVAGEVGYAGSEATFRSNGDFVAPWGAYITAILILTAIIWWIYVRIRRRLHRRSEAKVGISGSAESTVDVGTGATSQ
jgi:hypothetical protein